MYTRYQWLGGVLLIALVALIVVVMRVGASQPQAIQASSVTDPRTLMIPRWFLESMILDGEKADLTGKQLTLQFKEDGTANGQGGCNNFSGTYQAGADGKLKFGPLASTLMACASGMNEEQAYFRALVKVTRFQRPGASLILASADGKTVLTYHMPPK